MSENILETINKLTTLLEEDVLSVGDDVFIKSNKKYGFITKRVSNVLYEVEIPEQNGDMARTDTYYASDLELVNPGVTYEEDNKNFLSQYPTEKIKKVFLSQADPEYVFEELVDKFDNAAPEALTEYMIDFLSNADNYTVAELEELFEGE